MNARVRIVDPSGKPATFELTGKVIRLGRDPQCELAVDPEVYQQVSGLHARIEPTGSGFVVVPVSNSNKTLLNDAPIDDPAWVRAGDRIRLGFTGPVVEVLALSKSAPSEGAPPPAPAAEGGKTVQADAAQVALLRGSARADRFTVGRGGVIGREHGEVEFVLDHPHVSRHHARLRVKDDRVTLTDLGSANGTFVNGRRVRRAVTLGPGDRIDIGPFSLQFDGEELVGTSRSNNVELSARGVRRVVTDRGTGKELTLLDDVSLVVRPREFVALLGPSGSGKSTLMAMLSGRAAPDEGTVAVNGRELYANFAAVKQDIAVVPQRDVLHDILPVAAALGYTAELRLPPDTGSHERAKSVDDVLGVVGLAERGSTLIRHLSGGQLKRASLANELLARPSLLFLDEVTSGLDEETDREMMEQFRMLADGGKTVVCITHNLANVETSCHLVVTLTAGGRLAFVGTPAETLGYFGVKKLGDVYRKLAERRPAEWQEAFLASTYHAKYVRDRLPQVTAAHRRARPEDDEVERPGVNPVRQAWVLTRRYLSIWRGDGQALLALLGQALLIALLIAAVFGRSKNEKDPVFQMSSPVNLFFLLGISSFWLGCNTSAKELVKERVIYDRERAFNLRADSYYASKLVVLLGIAVLQVVLLYAIVAIGCAPPGNAAGHLAVLLLLAAAGTSLGLLLSAAARTEEVATALVPVAVIPQIVLAGVIAPLSGFPEVLAKLFVSCYWGQRGLMKLLDENAAGTAAFGPAWWVVPQAALCVAAALALLTLRSHGKAR